MDWQWQSADAALGKARQGGGRIGPNPTDRGKRGVKRRVLAATLDAIVVERPQPTPEQPQHLGLDTGYDTPTGKTAAATHG